MEPHSVRSGARKTARAYVRLDMLTPIMDRLIILGRYAGDKGPAHLTQGHVVPIFDLVPALLVRIGRNRAGTTVDTLPSA